MIDITSLLDPISDADACGEDLSFSLEFDAIQEARRSDDASLDQGEWVTELKSADWAGVSRQCAKLLGERSKDLRLAVWMAEALARTDGFAGLAEGFRLAAGLCQRYWDEIHPRPDEDDQELRIGNLAWLLSQSVGWIRAIPLTDAPQGRFNAATLEAVARGHQGDDADNFPDQARVDAARAATPYDFYRRLAEQVPLAQAALRELEAVVDARLGQNGPSFSATRDALTDVGGMALRMASNAGVALADDAPAAAASPTATSAPAESAAAPATAAARANGEITSRKEALQQLRRVADFFRRTEPHSPVAYLADKAARWGNMPLHVWLKSVLKDNPALGQLEEMLDVGGDNGGND